MEDQKDTGKAVDVVAKQLAAQISRGAEGGKIDKLAAAYVDAWAELDVVVKNSTNPHFKSNYADLTAVLDTIRPVFAKYKLALFQAPGRLVELANGELAATITGVLFHGSGQSVTIETQLPLGAKPTAQSTGSAITYARRYQAQAVGGIAPVDDDGNQATVTAASAPPPPKKDKAKEAPKAKKEEPEPPSTPSSTDSAPTPEGLQKKIAAAVKLAPEAGLEALKAIKTDVRTLADQYTANQWIKAHNDHKEAQSKEAA